MRCGAAIPFKRPFFTLNSLLYTLSRYVPSGSPVGRSMKLALSAIFAMAAPLRPRLTRRMLPLSDTCMSSFCPFIAWRKWLTALTSG